MLGYRQNAGSSADFTHGIVMAIMDFRSLSEFPLIPVFTDKYRRQNQMTDLRTELMAKVHISQSISARDAEI